MFRVNLNNWWWGVPLLTRGPQLSLPIALATDYPTLQVMLVVSVLVMFLTVYISAVPWMVLSPAQDRLRDVHLPSF